MDQQVVAHKPAVLIVGVTSVNEYGRSFKNWVADALAFCIAQNAKTLQTISEVGKHPFFNMLALTSIVVDCARRQCAPELAR